MDLALPNLSKLANFIDSKLYDISHIKKNDINIIIKKFQEETKTRRIEQKNIKYFLNKTHSQKLTKKKISKR